MKRATLITGLDIGSSKVAGVVAEIRKSGELEILAQATLPSAGISRGVITALSEAVNSVSAVFGKLSEKISRRPDNIYVNISGEDIKGSSSRGMIPIALRGREVAKGDIARCVEAAGTIHLPFDREVIHRSVHNFSIDDQVWIKNPLGLYASRLNCEVYIITADVNHIENIHKCVNNAGYDISEVVFTPLADGAGLLNEEEKSSGVLLLDMGNALTESTIFSNGSISDVEIVPMGSRDIKGDLIESQGLADIINRINSRIDVFLKSGGTLSSIVLTGGLAFSDGIIEALEGRLPYRIRLGAAKEMRGSLSSLDSVRLSTALGLVKYAHNKHMTKVRESRDLPKNIYAKVVDIFNYYF